MRGDGAEVASVRRVGQAGHDRHHFGYLLLQLRDLLLPLVDLAWTRRRRKKAADESVGSITQSHSESKSHDVISSSLVSTPTLCYLQLPLGVPQRGEQVQLDPGLGAQAVLQVLGLLLHRRQG